jgi:hypothetical protein
MALPNLGMVFTPFDPLPASDLNDIVENVEALAAGTGLNDDAIIARHVADDILTADMVNQAEWGNISRFYGYRTSNQTTTSSVNQLLVANSPSSNVQVSHTTKTGRVKVRVSSPLGNSANNMQISVLTNGSTPSVEVNNFSINDSSMKYGEGQITGLTAGTTYTFGVYMKVDGGATATFYAFRTITLIIEDY